MSIVSTKVVVKVSKKITKEVTLDNGMVLTFVKKMKTKKVKKTLQVFHFFMVRQLSVKVKVIAYL